MRADFGLDFVPTLSGKEPVAQIVISSKHDFDAKKDRILSSFYRMDSQWKDQSPEHQESWNAATKKFQDSHGGSSPSAPQDWATVMALAKKHYAKHYGRTDQKVRFGKKQKVLAKRIISVLRKKFSQRIILRLPKNQQDIALAYRSTLLQKGTPVDVANSLVSEYVNTLTKRVFQSEEDDAEEDWELMKNRMVDEEGLTAEEADKKIEEMKKEKESQGSSVSAKKSLKSEAADSELDGNGEKKIKDTGDNPKPNEAIEDNGTGGPSNFQDYQHDRVQGDPQDEIDENITLEGDEGETVADTTVDEEYNTHAFNFGGNEENALEIPIEGTPDTQIVTLKKVSPHVFIFKESFISKGRTRTSFVSGKDVDKLFNGKVSVSPIVAKLDGRVIPLRNSDQALIIKKSSVLQYIVIKAPFLKGLNNSRYTVFSRHPRSKLLVNENGVVLSGHKGPVIASEATIKSKKTSDKPMNLFSDVERRYLFYQKVQMHNFKNEIIHQQRLLQKEKDERKSDGKSALESSVVLTQKIAELQAQLQQYQKVPVGSSQQQNTVKPEEILSENDKNVSFLEKMMRSI
jgi:hypothetical protein